MSNQQIVNIIGTGSYLPEKVITNNDIAEL